MASRATVTASFIIASFTVTAVRIAYAHQGHGAGHAPKPTSDEIAAFERAKPAFERHCFRCHATAGSKSKPKALTHIAMDGYPFGGRHADEAGSIVRKALGARGAKATMPSDDPGAVTGEDLARILAWADAFEHAHPAHMTEGKQKTDAH